MTACDHCHRPGASFVLGTHVPGMSPGYSRPLAFCNQACQELWRRQRQAQDFCEWCRTPIGPFSRHARHSLDGISFCSHTCETRFHEDLIEGELYVRKSLGVDP